MLKKKIPYMKKIIMCDCLRAAIGFALSFLLIVTMSSCAKKVSFPTSSVVPAAEGTVKIKPNDGNYSIDVALRHLAPSDKLDPPRKMYVVWVETKTEGVKNIGSMNSSSGFVSKALKASLSATLAFKPTRIFITAEDEPTPPIASRQVVLRTETFKVR
jgi:hypothetical protein